jgi:hypothetical protein
VALTREGITDGRNPVKIARYDGATAIARRVSNGTTKEADYDCEGDIPTGSTNPGDSTNPGGTYLFEFPEIWSDQDANCEAPLP